jgi:hypothetical protein
MSSLEPAETINKTKNSMFAAHVKRASLHDQAQKTEKKYEESSNLRQEKVKLSLQRSQARLRARLSNRQQKLKRRAPLLSSEKRNATIVVPQQSKVVELKKTQGVGKEMENKFKLTWQKVYDPSSGKHYYYCIETKDTTWVAPAGFDESKSMQRERDASMKKSWLELPHGLALLLAARKIQSVFRAKRGRKRSRGKRAKKAAALSSNTTSAGGQPKWIKVFDNRSGYYYYYNNEDDSMTWDVPKDYIDPSLESGVKEPVKEPEIAKKPAGREPAKESAKPSPVKISPNTEEVEKGIERVRQKIRKKVGTPKRLQKIFQRLDEDNSNAICESEFHSLLMAVLKMKVAAPMFDAIWTSVISRGGNDQQSEMSKEVLELWLFGEN